MLKIRALNRESSSDEDAPGIRKEAQEEMVLDMYNKSLRLQCSNNLTEAKDLLLQLLEENIPLLESQGGLPKTMSTIKYSCYRNIGDINLNLGDIQGALDYLLEAAELDKTDVTLWRKIGEVALKLDRFHQAAYAFAQGLECSENNWPCLDRLISVAFVIKDTIGCLQCIGKALILDENYTKGMVLKKKIYENNPATEEYYKLMYPGHIYEPQIEYNVSLEEETDILNEVQKLCDQLHAFEETKKTKPLSTVLLPRKAKEFTWLELGEIITELHQYLSDKNMSHLSKIDINNSMQNGEDIPHSENNSVSIQQINNSEVMETENVSSIDADAISENKQSTTPVLNDSSIVERRPSQNSENDTTPQEETEEMEQDAEEGDESMQKQDPNRKSNSSSKRKRDLVSELQIWGWHSKRKSAKRSKTDKDLTVEDALNRIIPSHLLPSGLNVDKIGNIEETTSPLINLNQEELLNFPEIPPYFGTEQEINDVKSFWAKNWEHCDVIDLIAEYVYKIGQLWNVKWPQGLVDVYVKAYNMFREHVSHPSLHNTEITMEEFKRDALCTLLYGELITHTNNKKYLEEELHCSSEHFITMVSSWGNAWEKTYDEFVTRVHWLRGFLYKNKDESSLAVMAFQLVQEMIDSKGADNNFKLYIPNTEKHNLVNRTIMKAILDKLELIDSLSRVQELFDKEMYSEVAEILKITFANSTQVTFGTLGRPVQLGILMHSLWYSNPAECFTWTEYCLHETLGHIFKPTEDKGKWEMILEKCLLIMYELIKMETVIVVDNLSDMQRIRFTECLCSLCIRQVNSESQNASVVANIMPYPWILLHFILQRDEHRQQAKRKVQHIQKDVPAQTPERVEQDEEDIPPSIAVLFSAHEFLGPKGWCLGKQGELLHFMLDTVVHRLDTPIFDSIRDKIELHLEQAFFCLYQHPCKKNKVSRHLADHNVNPLPLTWERAQQLYDFFCPESLPEFDSYKSISISADLEQLLQRIIAIIPKECDPQPLLPKISEFISGNLEEIPKAIEFSAKARSAYYLLGDYFFKQSEVKRSYKYFLLDLCINPNRIDSWAGLALGIHSQLEYKLNHCEGFKNEMEFLDKSKSAKICFQGALKLNDAHVTLWIEYGSFEYMVHSFCSRVLKYESESLNIEKFDILEAEKDRYLESSRKSFERALSLYEMDSDADERWLFHYMIGKVSEKKQEDPNIYLQHYMRAAELLNENKCQYPEKINYNNPQHLSLEALEVHYRINASILKYLSMHDGKIVPSSLGKLFKKCLDSSVIQKSKYEAKTKEENRARNILDENIKKDVMECIDDMIKKVEMMSTKASKVQEKAIIRIKSVQDIMGEIKTETLEKPTVVEKNQNQKTELDVKAKVEGNVKDEKSPEEANVRKSTTTEGSSSSSSSTSSSGSDSESDDSSSESTSTDSAHENMSDVELVNLLDRCIVGLEQCIRRLPQNYKALYRLAHVYHSHSKKKDLNKSKQLLLSEYKCKNGVLVSGLFSDRKTSNFFNGIWRIPSSEIDRPGSLSAHMSRCVTLLLHILSETHDHRILFELCLQLKRVPDPDKVYIRHTEREQLAEEALTMCIQTLKTLTKDVATMSSENADRLLVDIYKAYQRSQKNLPSQEKVFAAILIDTYKKIMGDKISEKTQILDLALKYCQQTRVAEKIKKQQLPPVLPKQPTISTTVAPQVVPTTIATNVPLMPPIKRSPFGRPRGRPPGSTKSTTTIKSPRGRSPLTGNFPWGNYSNPSFYLKQYQEELLRQYSQTLSMSQMAGNFQQSLFGNNFLNSTHSPQTSMPVGSTLFQQMTSGINTLAANQLSQSLSQLSPNVLKSLSNQLAAPATTSAISGGLSTEQYRQIANLMSLQRPPKQSRPQKTKAAYVAPKQQTSQEFKYPSAEIIKTKPKDVMKSTFLASKDMQNRSFSLPGPSSVVEKPNSLMRDRPGISITPVMPPLPPPRSSNVNLSPSKTLQEKLQDKQNQQKKVPAVGAVGLNKLPHRFANTAGFPTASQQQHSSIDIPNYLLESGLSISQVQQKKAPLSPQIAAAASAAASKSKPSSNGPISMSVVKKPEEKEPLKQGKKADDIIIIE